MHKSRRRFSSIDPAKTYRRRPSKEQESDGRKEKKAIWTEKVIAWSAILGLPLAVATSILAFWAQVQNSGENKELLRHMSTLANSSTKQLDAIRQQSIATTDAARAAQAASQSNAKIAVQNALQTGLIGKQADAMEGQVSALRDEQRPWLAVELHSISLDMSADAINGHARARITNIGKSTAFSARVRVWATTDRPQVEALQDRMCREFSRSRRHFDFAQVVHPGASIEPLSRNFRIHRRDVRHNPFEIWLFGCVDYTFGSPRLHHQIRFIYQIDHAISQRRSEQGSSETRILLATTAFSWGDTIAEDSVSIIKDSIYPVLDVDMD